MNEGGQHSVLIAGGGVAALEAALALRALAPELVSVELLAPEPHFWYKPLSVAEPFHLGEVRQFELSGLARALGASFTPGALVSVDEVEPRRSHRFGQPGSLRHAAHRLWSDPVAGDSRCRHIQGAGRHGED